HRRNTLVRRAGIMGPAIFLDRRIDSGVGLLGRRHLAMLAGILESKKILQKIARHLAWWLAEDAETGKVLRPVHALEVERQQGLAIAGIGLHGKGMDDRARDKH